MAQKRKAGRARPVWSDAPENLFDYARPTARRTGRLRVNSEESIKMTDDWPEVVPITEIELRVIESYFVEELDDLLGPLA